MRWMYFFDIFDRLMILKCHIIMRHEDGICIVLKNTEIKKKTPNKFAHCPIASILKSRIYTEVIITYCSTFDFIFYTLHSFCSTCTNSDSRKATEITLNRKFVIYTRTRTLRNYHYFLLIIFSHIY